MQFVAFRSAKERYARSLAERKATVGLATSLIACLLSFSTTAIAQEIELVEPEPQTLEVQVVDEEGQPIQDASVVPRSVGYQRHPRETHVWEPGIEGEATKVTDERGAATLVFPVNSKRPITEVGIHTKHDSFVKKFYRAKLNENPVKITLKRGLQIAASAIDPVTKEPIKENLYALTNRHTPVDWKFKSNGTLVSPVIGEDEKSFRSFGPIQSSGKILTELRHKGRKSWLSFGMSVFRILRGDDGSELRDFYNEFSFCNNLTDTGGNVVIDGVPSGTVQVIVSCPSDQGSADIKSAHKLVVVPALRRKYLRIPRLRRSNFRLSMKKGRR